MITIVIDAKLIKMSKRIIKKGEKLSLALQELSKDDVLEVPFKLYSANSIRAATSRLKRPGELCFEVDTQGRTTAQITRTI